MISLPRIGNQNSGMTLVSINPVDLRSKYNDAHFPLLHRLHDGELADLDALRHLISRRPVTPRLAYWSTGAATVEDSWSAGVDGHRELIDTFDHLADESSLIMLKHLEEDSLFGPVIAGLISSLKEHGGEDMRRDQRQGRATLLIASPRRITSYHMDADTNFLFQIRGHKLFYVFDQRDPAVLSAEERERFFRGDANAAKYSAARQALASAYELSPGSGLHVPSLAPHWAQNGDEVSVALSINFDLRSVEAIGRIHRVNGYLREAGLKPRAPGMHRTLDVLKGAAERGFGALNRRLKLL